MSLSTQQRQRRHNATVIKKASVSDNSCVETKDTNKKKRNISTLSSKRNRMRTNVEEDSVSIYISESNSESVSQQEKKTREKNKKIRKTEISNKMSSDIKQCIVQKTSNMDQPLQTLSVPSKENQTYNKLSVKKQSKYIKKKLNEGDETNSKGRRFVQKYGYELPEYPDYSQLRRNRLKLPRGWCQKYWWDTDFPSYHDESGGFITVYTEQHEKIIRAVNVVLSLALIDDSRKQIQTNEYKILSQNDTHTNIHGCLSLKHQIFRDLIRYPFYVRYQFLALPESLLISSDSALQKKTASTQLISLTETQPHLSTNQSINHTKMLLSDINRVTEDTLLMKEINKQNALRQRCANLKSMILSVYKAWETQEGIWVHQYTDN